MDNIGNEGFQPNFDDDDDLMLLIAAAEIADLEEQDIADDQEEVDEPGIFANVDAWIHLRKEQFASHFRMSKNLFENLVETVGAHLHATGRWQRIRTPLNVIVLAVLWILSNHDTFRSTAIKFNMTPGVLHYHYRYIIEAIRELAPRFIQWPGPEKRVRIKRTFLEMTGYPDCVGAIDGTHVYVTAPIIDKQTFVNRFFKYSIVAQAVVDCDMVVRDLYVGEPGSMHDARVLMRSPLGTRLYTDPQWLSPDEHIIGDGAYMLTDKVQSPYRWRADFDPVRKLYNQMLSSARMVVERAFGQVKGKFRRLKYFQSYSIEYAIDHIVSSFVLHNFILLNGIPFNEQDILQDSPADDAGPAEGLPRDGPILTAARAAGTLKRDRMAALFSGLLVED